MKAFVIGNIFSHNIFSFMLVKYNWGTVWRRFLKDTIFLRFVLNYSLHFLVFLLLVLKLLICLFYHVSRKHKHVHVIKLL